MIGGVDITFDLDGEPKTMQVKKVSNVSTSNNKVTLHGLTVNKHYDVDYLAITNNNKPYIFEYDPDKIDIIDKGELQLDLSLWVR